MSRCLNITNLTLILLDKSINVAMVVIHKRTMVKMITHTNDNPQAGTILDHTVTKGNDFYLVPMNTSMGTVSPTHYIVKEHDKLEANQIQRIAYALSHMYFNWTGTVKIPAPCQYAQKLTDLAGVHLRASPSEELSQTLFYLWKRKVPKFIF